MGLDYPLHFVREGHAGVSAVLAVGGLVRLPEVNALTVLEGLGTCVGALVEDIAAASDGLATALLRVVVAAEVEESKARVKATPMGRMLRCCLPAVPT